MWCFNRTSEATPTRKRQPAAALSMAPPPLRVIRFHAARLQPSRQQTVLLSLFSGCGGLDLGFERAGFPIGLAYDIRTASIASWNRNRLGTDRGHVADLTTIRLADMDRHYGATFVPSGVIGGPPCQSFSPANRSPLPDDPRSKLVHRFFSIALRVHRHRGPLDFILLENVPGLAAAENGHLLDRELERLDNHDFDASTFLVNAVCHSVPQYRNRLFLLALRKTTSAATRWTPPPGTDKKKTVSDAIGGLPSPAYFTRGLTPNAIPLHPNHWCMTPKSHRFFDGSLAEGDSSARSFKTLAWNEPSITVSYGHREVHVHPDGTRRLSVFEAMRLQGFPNQYRLEGTLSAQIDQVSEAVPPPLAEAVARSIALAICLPAANTSAPAHAPTWSKAARS